MQSEDSQATATSDVTQTTAELKAKATATATDAVESAAQAAKEQVGAAKSTVADEMSSVASALRTAADELRSGSPQERTFGQIAEGLADASDAVRDKDLGALVQDVSAFARRNPLVFLGGAALVGFAATRFAKASGQDLTGTPVQTSPVASGDYTTFQGEL